MLFMCVYCYDHFVVSVAVVVCCLWYRCTLKIEVQLICTFQTIFLYTSSPGSLFIVSNRSLRPVLITSNQSFSSTFVNSGVLKPKCYFSKQIYYTLSIILTLNHDVIFTINTNYFYDRCIAM